MKPLHTFLIAGLGAVFFLGSSPRAAESSAEGLGELTEKLRSDLAVQEVFLQSQAEILRSLEEEHAILQERLAISTPRLKDGKDWFQARLKGLVESDLKLTTKELSMPAFHGFIDAQAFELSFSTTLSRGKTVSKQKVDFRDPTGRTFTRWEERRNDVGSLVGAILDPIDILYSVDEIEFSKSGTARTLGKVKGTIFRLSHDRCNPTTKTAESVQGRHDLHEYEARLSRIAGGLSKAPSDFAAMLERYRANLAQWERILAKQDSVESERICVEVSRHLEEARPFRPTAFRFPEARQDTWPESVVDRPAVSEEEALKSQKEVVQKLKAVLAEAAQPIAIPSPPDHERKTELLTALADELCHKLASEKIRQVRMIPEGRQFRVR